MGGSLRRESRIERAAVLALGLVVVAAPLPLGSTPGWAIVGVTALAAVALVGAAALARARGTSIAVPATAMLAVGLALYTGLQALPLPCGLAAWLQPAAAESARASAELAGGTPWCAASLDPGATREHFVEALGLACTFAAALILATLTGRRTIMVIVGVSCAIGATVGLAHLLSGATVLYGLLTPVHAVPFLAGPFVNPNVAGGMHALGAVVGAATAFDSETRGDRATWGAVALGCAVACVATLSRGAVAGLVGGLFLLAFTLRGRSRDRRASLPRLGWQAVFVAPALVAAVVLAAQASIAVLGADLGSTDASKLGLIRRAAEFSFSAPWTGVGRGAFGVAFTSALGTLQRFEHAESFVVEWVVDWGLPVAVLAVSVLLRDVVRALLASRKPLVRAALVGVIVYGLHNLVDLGTEVYGSALVVAALAGAGLARHADSAATGKGWGATRVSRSAAALAATTFITLALTAQGVMGAQVDVLQARLGRARAAHERGTFARVLAAATRAHPHEPVFALLAGAEAVDRDDPKALRWLTRSMRLAPRWYSPHELAARWLFTHGRSGQATLELREIAKLDEGSAVTVLCRLPVELRTASTIATVARGSQRGLVMADRVAGCLDAGSAESARLDELLLVVRPPLRAPRLRQVHRLLTQGDTETALAAARRIVADYPREYDARLLLADALLRSGHPAEAVEELGRAGREGGLDWYGVALQARAFTQIGDLEAMRLAIDELRGLAAGDAGRVVEVELLHGALEEGAHNDGQALRAFEQAVRLRETAAGLRGVVRCAQRLGAPDRVASATRALCELEPTAAECAAH